MKISKRKGAAFRLLLCCLLLSLSIGTVPVLAIAQPSLSEINPRWTHFISVGCKLEISSTGVATISGYATANSSNTTSVSVYLRLQKKTANGAWSYVTSFSDSGRTMASVYETYQLSGSGDYRVLLTATATGNGSETVTCSSYDSFSK